MTTPSRKLVPVVTRKYGLLVSDLFIRGLAEPRHYTTLFLLPDAFVETGVFTDRWCFGPRIRDLGRALFERGQKDRRFLPRMFRNVYKYGSQLRRISTRLKEDDWSDMPASELQDVFSRFVPLYERFALALAGWALQAPVETRLREILAGRPTADEDLALLTFPTKINDVTREQEELTKLATLFQLKGIAADNMGDLPAPLRRRVERHADQYGWINMRGGLDTPWSPTDILARVREALREDCRSKLDELYQKRKDTQRRSVMLLRSLGRLPELPWLVRTAKELVYYRTYRTDELNLAFANIRSLLTAIAKTHSCTLDDLFYHRVEEMTRSVVVSPQELGRRKAGFALVAVRPREVLFASDPEHIAEFQEKYLETATAGTGELRGQVAYRGRVDGRVVLMRGKRDNPRAKQGDILVAAMTTPDFVPAMERAAAFVTDEGGITCHAAIVAREMKKPCIIGTGNATKMLNDGDLVEVDADKGIVRVVKRA